jgi:DHA2 family multidrug resistance protein
MSATASAAAVPVVARPSTNKWLVAISVSFGSLMATIDTSIVNVAMPHIRGAVSATLQEITWVSTGYIIATVVVMPLTGFLGALIGQKRLYLGSLVLFVLGSVLCGMARSLPALVIFRILQGFGGGALQPTQQAILRQTFPAREQGMAMAVFAMVNMIGPAIGPTLGGFITDNYSWPWIFYINVPVGIVGVIAVTMFVTEPEDVRLANRARAAAQRNHMDWAGIALMTVTVAFLQYFLEEGAANDWFESPLITACAFIAGVALIAFVIRELTAEVPAVNLRLFKDRTFLSGTAIAAVMFGMLVASMFLLPVFMQETLHYDATRSGVTMMPRTVAMMIATPIVGRLYNRVPPAATIAFGVLLFVVGNYQLAQITLETSPGDLVVPLVVTGVALSCLFVPLTTAALTHIPRHQIADAAGLNSFVRQMGGSIGLTVFTTLLSRYVASARANLVTHLADGRGEVMTALAQMKAGFVARGYDAAAAHELALRLLNGRASAQAMVLAFEKSFFVQGIAFLAVLPLLFFLRVGPRTSSAAPAAAHMSME